MSIFSLHSNVLADYRDFVRSFFTVADDRAREFINRELVEEARLWPEALLQVSPSYARVASVDELAARGVLLLETAQIFRNDRGEPFYLYQHQAEVLEGGKVTSSPAARVRARASRISCPSLMRFFASPLPVTASPRSSCIP